MSTPKVFVSYAHSDKKWARQFVRSLKSRGADAWMDEDVLSAGESYESALEKGFRNSDILVLIVNSKSVKSPNLFFELGAALGLGKRVVPVVSHDVDFSVLPQPLSRSYLLQESPEETASAIFRAPGIPIDETAKTLALPAPIIATPARKEAKLGLIVYDMKKAAADILMQIDQVSKSINVPIPGLWQQMANPSARDRAIAIEKAKTSAIAARRQLIEGMAASIQVYVDTHREVLKDLAQGSVTATFLSNRAKLYTVSEAAIVSSLEAYSVYVDEIHRSSNLTDEQKKERIRVAYERAVEAMRVAEKTSTAILDELRNQIIETTKRIEVR